MDLSRIVTSYRIKQALNIFAITAQGVAMLAASLSWGKADGDGVGYHLLTYHYLDMAAVR